MKNRGGWSGSSRLFHGRKGRGTTGDLEMKFPAEFRKSRKAEKE
jgi:hypothetical protein